MKRSPPLPRVEDLHVTNYRALREIQLRNLTPLTVLVGPNGSGKSTVFDVFSFLSEILHSGLRDAWEARGRMRELRTRGQNGPLLVGLTYRERPNAQPGRYLLKIDEQDGAPVIIQETLVMNAGQPDKEQYIIHSRNGEGTVFRRDQPKRRGADVAIRLRSPDLTALNALGQLADHPRIAALREFILGWHVSYLSIADTRASTEAGTEEYLNRSGSNLGNVLQYLSEQHPQLLVEISRKLAQRVPHLARVIIDRLADGRLSLKVKDAPFDDPILARFASDGTLKMLAYLVLLHGPTPPPFIGIEEPENYLHPRLMYPLAEEFRSATERSQILVTTHSPHLIDALRPEEVCVLYRDKVGHTQVKRTADIEGVREFVEHGGQLGDLWMEGHFNMGDPLTNHGMPRLAARR